MEPSLKNLLKDRIPEVQLDLKRIKTGTSVAFDLYDEYGNVIVEMNTPFTDALIKHLKSNDIEFLYYNPEYSTLIQNVAGLNTEKNIIADAQQKESVDLAKEIIDSIKDSIDFTHKTITPEKIKKAHTHVDNIVKHIENTADSIFSPFTKLKNLDEYTYLHSSNVSILAAILGSRLEYNRTVRVNMGVGGLFHDIGKALIDEKILNKKGKLNEDEYTIIKEHPELGHKIIKDIPDLSILEKNIILYHHERPDTLGYPFKYDYNNYTSNVPKEIRLLSICDAYSALILERSYKPAYSPKKALRIIVNSVYAPFKKQSQFLPADIRDFIRSMAFMLTKGEYFFNRGETIRLSTGEVAIIEEMNRLYPLNPKIKLLTNKQLQPLNRPVSVDLLRDINVYIAHIFDKSTKQADTF
jgi:HD-GYP domain-containing protein (c-di-GMP phosphodiesterase class II)